MEDESCGLLVRQGWAFVIVDAAGKVTALASGVTPCWAEGFMKNLEMQDPGICVEMEAACQRLGQHPNF